MILLAEPLPAGDAVRVLLAPPEGATATRVLRKAADTISGPDDPAAAKVYEGDEISFVDTASILNLTPYFYRAFHRVDGAWIASPTVAATPAHSLIVQSVDALVLVRDRLAAFLKGEIVAGRITHPNGAVPVLTAPPRETESLSYPMVTVHLRSDAPETRALGESLGADVFDGGRWTAGEGWLSRVQLEIVSWVPNNADLRNAVRGAIKAALVANLPVFEAKGLQTVEFSQADVEDFESFNSPMYQTVISLSGLCGFVVQGLEDAVTDVEVGLAA